MSTSRSENEMISLAITLAGSIREQDRYARKEPTLHLTTVTNWERLLELSNRVFETDERRLKE